MKLATVEGAALHHRGKVPIILRDSQGNVTLRGLRIVAVHEVKVLTVGYPFEEGALFSGLYGVPSHVGNLECPLEPPNPSLQEAEALLRALFAPLEQELHS